MPVVGILIYYNKNTIRIVYQRSEHAVGWMTGVRFPGGAGIFLPVRHRVQTGSQAHTASFQKGTRVSFSWGQNDRGVKLTTHLLLVPRLGSCGVIPPLYIFMAWYLVSLPTRISLFCTSPFCDCTLLHKTAVRNQNYTHEEMKCRLNWGNSCCQTVQNIVMKTYGGVEI
jgi:hypothetical protein